MVRMAETVRIEIPIEVFDNTDPELGNVIRNLNRAGQAADQAGDAAQQAGRRVTQFDRSSERTQRTLSQLSLIHISEPTRPEP